MLMKNVLYCMLGVIIIMAMVSCTSTPESSPDAPVSSDTPAVTVDSTSEVAPE